jgi:hypothetical protein
MAESLWHQVIVPNIANHDRSILSVREASGNTTQAETNEETPGLPTTMQRLSNLVI